MECPKFRHLLLLRSDLKTSSIPGRTKIHELLIQAWGRYFQDLRRDLTVRLSHLLLYSSHPFLLIQAAVGQVSFMLDTWSGQNFRPYLAMTAHWIAEVNSTLQLKTALVAFHRLRHNHTGKSLARTVMHLLDRAGVTVKVRRVYS